MFHMNHFLNQEMDPKKKTSMKKDEQANNDESPRNGADNSDQVTLAPPLESNSQDIGEINPLEQDSGNLGTERTDDSATPPQDPQLAVSCLPQLVPSHLTEHVLPHNSCDSVRRSSHHLLLSALDHALAIADMLDLDAILGQESNESHQSDDSLDSEQGNKESES